jgi:diguanylate cyclase (GGDEF)-like protein
MSVKLSGTSLRRSLLLSYVTLVMAMSVSLLWAVGDRVDQLLTDWARQRVAAQSLALAQRLEDALRERVADLRLLAGVPTYVWVGRVDAAGRVLAATDGLLEGESVAGQAWFAHALQKPMLGDAREVPLLAGRLPTQAPGRAPRFIDVAAPVRDPAGGVIGVVGAHLSLQWAQALQERMTRQVSTLGDAEVLIVDRAGEVLIGPPTTLGRPMWELMGGAGYLVGLAATTAQSEAEGLGWSVLVRVPRSQALQEIAQVRWAIAGVAGIVVLLALIFADLMSRLVSAPLRRLAREARQIIAGEARGFAVIRGYRESVELSHALHTLIESLGRRRQELEQLASGLEREVGERTAALESANRRLAELAITDPLTGLYNRRHFDERLLEAARRCAAGDGGVALILVDIDHFKRINDRHGHPTGDEVLRQVSRLLAESLRPSDLLARIGGEEFAVLAADGNAEEGRQLGQRLLERIRSASPLAVGRLRIPLSVSLGLAACRSGRGAAQTMAERLLSQADGALYAAKAGGRNRLCEAPDAAPDGSG